MGQLLHILFGAGTWGTGGNLVADLLTVIPTLLAALWRHRRQIHARLDQIEASLNGGHHGARATSTTAPARSPIEPGPPLTSDDPERSSRPSDKLTGG